MRGMPRRTMITVVLLILTAVLIVFWIRSYGAPQTIAVTISDSQPHTRSHHLLNWRRFESRHGEIRWRLGQPRSHEISSSGRRTSPGSFRQRKDLGFVAFGRETLGIDFDTRLPILKARKRESTITCVVIRYWGAVLLLLGMMAVINGQSLERLITAPFRTKEGHCRGCGYDLTGNISGVCPECGKPVLAADESTPAVPSPASSPPRQLSAGIAPPAHSSGSSSGP
jgi:hypothetical protein